MRISICIPTFNRCNFLKKSLDSLVCQQIFIDSNIFEIVVSDNNSNDGTKKIMTYFTKKYPNKIIYVRNNKNIQDKNFFNVIKKSKGDFIKLCNDTLIYSSNFLDELYEIVKYYFLKNKPIIYFANKNLLTNQNYTSSLSPDEFYQTVSFGPTWLGTFSCWRDDFNKYGSVLNNKAYTRLPHLYFTNYVLLFKKEAVIIPQRFFTVSIPSRSGNYNIFKVFYKNYINSFRLLVQKHYVSKKTFENLKWDVLWNHILPRYFNFKYVFYYKKNNLFIYCKDKKFEIKFYLYLSYWFIASKYKKIELTFRRKNHFL